MGQTLLNQRGQTPLISAADKSMESDPVLKCAMKSNEPEHNAMVPRGQRSISIITT